MFLINRYHSHTATKINLRALLLFLLLGAVFVSCTPPSFSSKRTVPFPARSEHSLVALDGAIYVIGGQAGNSSRAKRFDDVWKSTDGGKIWTEVTARSTQKFSARAGHSSVVIGSGIYEGIYVIGGSADGTPEKRFNDVWKSTDGGKTWTEVTASSTQKFPARSEHSSAVQNGDIYVIGGFVGNSGSNRLNDVWKSTDGGVNWTEVTTTGSKFSGRAGHSSVVQNGAIYVIGGSGSPSLIGNNDVWKSTNGGQTWTEVTASSTQKFAKRSFHASVVIGSAIYVIGGDDSENGVWKSTDDGQNWMEVRGAPKFTVRGRIEAIAVGTNMYVIGGAKGNTFMSDVWESTNSGKTWTEVNDGR